MGEMRNAYKILVGKPEGERPLGSLGSGQGLVAGCCNHNEPPTSIKGNFLTSWVTISFSRRTLFHVVMELLRVKVKVKLSLCFNSAPHHEGVLGEWKYSSTHSLTSALEGGEWSASRPGRFTPREGTPGTHWIGGWVGPRAVLDVVVKRKIPNPCQELNPRTLIVQPVAQNYAN
jgi:hypothetical protein